MKKIKKLALNRETLRNLVADDLERVAGGGPMSCPGTRQGTGCSTNHVFKCQLMDSYSCGGETGCYSNGAECA